MMQDKRPTFIVLGSFTLFHIHYQVPQNAKNIINKFQWSEYDIEIVVNF